MMEELEMIYEEFKDSCQNRLTHLDVELSKIRAGKATPSMLNNVKVEYYGSMTPIQQVANISTLDARTLTVQPWEKAILNDVAKGILHANIGLNPQSNGEMLIITVPPLTEERRKDLVRRVKAESENAKVAIRTHRKEAIDMVKTLKDDGLSEDLSKGAEEEIQQITNSFSKKIDDMVVQKEESIMTI
ncbi:MAG: ribosome recycling factor [Crocinitomicaceae bacterium]|nr:ribosome recycling factor [Crocinitomicaceae bacterium]